MRIRLNGRDEEVPDALSVAGLLARLGLRPEVVAVERNGALVRRRDQESTWLVAGDALEVVTLVGGG